MTSVQEPVAPPISLQFACLILDIFFLCLSFLKKKKKKIKYKISHFNEVTLMKSNVEGERGGRGRLMCFDLDLSQT